MKIEAKSGEGARGFSLFFGGGKSCSALRALYTFRCWIQVPCAFGLNAC